MKIRGMLVAVLCGALLPASAALPAQTAAAPQLGGNAQEQSPDRNMNQDPGRGRDLGRNQGMDGSGSYGDRTWDNDAFFLSLYQDPIFKSHGPGFKEGFRAGYEDARRDLEDGEHSHFGYRFRNPDHYRLEFGDHDLYIQEFQQGYKAGYQRGYAEQV
jgi:hypothetical protein